MSRKVELEVTIAAFADDGSVVDIIDTNRHYAYRFLSRLRRNVWGDEKPASHVAVVKPGAPIWNAARIAL